jgi:hypothetical protein
MHGEEKMGKVKKGWLAVRVDEDQRRFVIPIVYLYHPLFRRLLEAARDTYGYHSSGPLQLPCSIRRRFPPSARPRRAGHALVVVLQPPRARRALGPLHPR